MVEPKARAEIVSLISQMESEMGSSWSGPSMWADIVEHTATLIIDLKAHLDPVHLAVLMSIGAVADRQSKAEQKAKDRRNGEAYPTVRAAAFALLTAGLGLNQAAGNFLADCVVVPKPLAPEMRDYVALLLERAGLPPLNEGAAHE